MTDNTIHPPCNNCRCVYCNPQYGRHSFEQFQSPQPTGWVCPKCGSVYSPTTADCWRCAAPLVAVGSGND